MESARDLLAEEVRKVLSQIPQKIPETSKKIMNPLANSLKLTARMLPDFPKSDLKGLDWLFNTLVSTVPGLLEGLTDGQLEEAALKTIKIGLAVLDALDEVRGPRSEVRSPKEEDSDDV